MTAAYEPSIPWGTASGRNPWLPTELWKLARAALPESKAAQFRRESRYIVNQPAQLVAAAKTGGAWPVRIRDISPRGMQLITEEAILAPPEVRIRWNGRDISGIIRYNHKFDIGSYRIGIELDTRSDDLMREVLAHQSEELRDANFALDHQAGLVRQYAALLDLVSDAVAVLAPDGVVLFWNRAAERLYGWAGAEIVGRKLQSLVPCETPLGAGAASATELRKQRHIRKDGSPVDVLSRWCVKKDSAEEIQAIVWLSQVT